MHCNQLDQQLDEYLDGESSAAERHAFDAHVGSCARCRGELARAESLRAALGSLPVDPPSDGFEERVLERAIRRSGQRRAKGSSRMLAGSLVAACAAGILTVLIVEPLRAPQSGDLSGVELPQIAMTVDEPRTVNLVFAANDAFDDVSLLVELPAGVEVAGYAGRREIAWRTSMQAGRNVLPLELVARESASGELVARLRRGDDEKIFRVFVSAAS